MRTLIVGLLILSYSFTALAQGVSTGNAGLDAGDVITILIGLLTAVIGAFFAGAKREIERMVRANTADIVDLRAKNDEIMRMLLTDYNSKGDMTAAFSRMETNMEREISAIHRRLDHLNVPSSHNKPRQ